ncbi:MAG: N-acetylmuramoyl-L-alanine amidase [Romboutsia sp.]
MKNYRLIVTAIIAIGIILIGTSNPATNFYKTTNLIGNGINQNQDLKDESHKNNSKDKKIEDNKIENNQRNDNKEKKEVEKKFLICIDPGHQEKGNSSLEPIGPDSPNKKAKVSSGATGVATKKPEYILNLEASTVLKHILEGKGYEVIMTRETNNVDISNAQRAILANDKNADMVIRIHGDSIDNSSKTGASILIPEEGGKYTQAIFDKSDKCASLVSKKMKDAGINVNGIFQRGDLTGFNWSKVPVILIEMGFLSNYNEDLMLSNPDYQRKLMQSVADGVEEYLNTK